MLNLEFINYFKYSMENSTYAMSAEKHFTLLQFPIHFLKTA